MDNRIGDRIGELIETLGMKKVRFAERLRIDQSYVTQLTSGRRNPSDRTISDICREFNVREEWLRDGAGEMFLDFTEDEFSKAAASLSNDVFARSLLVEYWKLDDGSKKLFRDFIHNLSDNMRGLG
ncbi:helix-turn-helix transcriptional regulator [Lachnospiraceae bacterium 29-84]